MPCAGHNLIERRALVERFMLRRHGARCGGTDNECTYPYPHEIREETALDEDGRALYRRRSQEDIWVVRHNISLLKEFQCHINLEIIGGAETFAYLSKYFWKEDQTERLNIEDGEHTDEIDTYIKARYLSAHEACYRIF
jgi:hypothetical protein